MDVFPHVGGTFGAFMKRITRAFTLIELLVVIAIIAILAAILFPVFTQAKMAAKKTQALSNVKNIGMGTQIYTSANDDTYPLGNVYNPSNGRTSYNRFIPTPASQVTDWQPANTIGAASCEPFYSNAIQPFIKSYEIFNDPVATSTTSIYTLSFVGGMPYMNSKNNFAYAYNGLLNGLSATAVTAPGGLIIYSQDGNRKTPGAWFTNPTIDCTYNPSGACTYVAPVAGCGTTVAQNGVDSFFSRSTGGAGWDMYSNSWPVVFADGHAKTKQIGSRGTAKGDPRNDPFATWAGSNQPTSRWWASGDNGATLCHSYLFRPDIDFSTWDTAFESP